ncbi:MAG: flagellar basal body rod protein FlgB [Deltaproteobacteria bacterium]|nr:flagellar basal body rod protein FlgB [Deltaproteobacteria bacterium]
MTIGSIFRGVDAGQRALDYHLERANVLAGNVANIDTPGYRPRELVRPAEARSTTRLPLAVTSPEHVSSTRAVGASGETEVIEEGVASPGNDENAVSLEHELAKMSANQLRYDGAARLVQMQLGQLRYAANDGNGG